MMELFGLGLNINAYEVKIDIRLHPRHSVAISLPLSAASAVILEAIINIIS
jgi:hypothetical protein